MKVQGEKPEHIFSHSEIHAELQLRLLTAKQQCLPAGGVQPCGNILPTIAKVTWPTMLSHLKNPIGLVCLAGCSQVSTLLFIRNFTPTSRWLWEPFIIQWMKWSQFGFVLLHTKSYLWNCEFAWFCFGFPPRTGLSPPPTRSLLHHISSSHL